MTKKKIVQKKKPIRTVKVYTNSDPARDGVREVEMNPRPAVMGANRVAVYHTAIEVSIRFLSNLNLGPTYLHPDESLMEITNLCHVAMSPVVAKRLIEDLQAAIQLYEVRLGTIPEEKDLAAMWNARGGPHDG